MTLHSVMAVTSRYFSELGKHAFQHITVSILAEFTHESNYILYDVVVKKVHVRYLI